MNKIERLKIKNITLTGFRCFTHQTDIQMDDVTCISGNNGQGKTSIAHAIAFAFYGVTFFGEQAINRLMNHDTDTVEVSIHFYDQNGQTHTLTRRRHKDKTSLTLEGFTVRQVDIDTMLADKDLFLSLFNPLYFIEQIAGDGREFIQKLLPVVSKEDVLESLSESERKILFEVEFENTENAIASFRAKNAHEKEQLSSFNGKVDFLQEQADSYQDNVAECRENMSMAKEAEAQLSAKQSDGIDTEELTLLLCALKNSLADSNGQNTEIANLNAKLAELRQKQYVSKFTKDIAEVNADIKPLSAKYREIENRINTLKIGDKCPTCLLMITPQNIAQVKSELQKELEAVKTQGTILTAKRTGLLELDKKSSETFEQFKADDIVKAEARLKELLSSNPENDRRRISDEIQRAEEKLMFGNLNKNELDELKKLRTDIIGYDATLKTLEGQNFEAEIKTLLDEKKRIENDIRQNNDRISALHSYAAKRAELSLANLKMPHVKFQLFEIARTTGEVKDVFRFTYNGTDYRTLSLSEKTKAGLEVSALLRELTGLEYPVFIDNTESIANIDRSVLPAQTILSKVVKGGTFTVSAASNRPVLQKAG